MPGLHRNTNPSDGERPGFLADVRGSVTTLFGIGLPVAALLAIGTTEWTDTFSTRQALQQIVDSAALNGARGLGIDRSNATTTRTISYADTLAEKLRGSWQVTTTATTDPAFKSITVTQNATRPSLFGDLVAPGGFHISATATAVTSSAAPLCVLGSNSGSKVVTLSDASTMTAPKCLVQSNGDLIADGAAAVNAGAIRSVREATGKLSPAPVTDAPPVPDPFSSMTISPPNLCNDLTIQLLGGTQTLNAGVHCGAINLLGSGTLQLNPGDHYFTGLNLSVGGNVTITGTDVAMIFKGLSSAAFTGNATLTLEGRKSGPFAGFVLVADRSFTGTLSISTLNAKKLLGTIYLPNGTLAVSGKNNKVADQSAWTVVVAKKIDVSGSADLVINSDYNAATVPVPAGVGPGTIRLVN